MEKTSIDLRKKVVINLMKEIAPQEDIKANIIVVMDNSGSMSGEYSRGNVQAVLDRMLPIAMAFTPENKEAKMPVITFGDSSKILNESMDVNNYQAYVRRNIKGGSQGGTNFAPALEDVLDVFKEKNITSKFFGLSQKYTKPEIPTLVLFFTDGDAFDERSTRNAMCQMAQYPIFIQFVGLGGVNSRVLQTLDTMSGRLVDNANYFDINDIHRISDDELYRKLLTEFPDYIKAAKAANVL